MVYTLLKFIISYYTNLNVGSIYIINEKIRKKTYGCKLKKQNFIDYLNKSAV